MPRLALKQRRAVRFTAAALALALIAISSPAAVRAASDLIGGDAGADALAAALAAAASTDTPRLASAQASLAPARPSPLLAADAAGWEKALRDDPDIKFSPSTGRLIYACDHLIDNKNPAIASAEMAAADMAFAADANAVASGSGFAMPKEKDPAVANAFRLHSRPGAPQKIVLDFTGHTLRVGTMWGTNSKIGDVPIVTPPYDLDGNPSSFSTGELAAIVSIWRQVSEDFSPWDVDVTTEEPPGTDNQGDSSLLGVGLRVIIGNNTGWFDGNSGGVAFVGGFGEAWSGPAAFVFNTNPPGVAIAASHMVGHTLGLKHHGILAKPDGTPAAAYYPGHNGWAPIMGLGYGKNVVQWSKGDYAYATNPQQDDMAVIGNTLSAAPWLGGGRDVATAQLVAPALGGAPEIVSGIFTSGSESHLYKVAAARAVMLNLQLSVNPKSAAEGSSRTHLAVKVRVVQASTNAVVGTPFDNAGPSGIDKNIPDTPTYSIALPTSGDYFVELAAARSGDATTGYTEYGSSGTYALTVSVNAVPPDTVTCLNPSYTLASGQCDGKAVPPAELYRLAGPGGAAPSGTATTTLPADGVLGPGKHQIQVTASAGGATCTSVVTVTPCRPAVISTTTAVRVLSAPGVCAGTPAPSAVVSAATLGRGALSINARTSSTGSIVPMPLKAGKYYVQVVYPGSVMSSVSSSSVPISVTDVEDPRAAIKPAIVRDSRGFICARGGSSTSTTACVSLSTSTGVLDLADNCGVSSLTRSYQCSSSQNACPSTMSSTTTKLCVPVKAGGGRIEATYLLTVTDKGGRKAQVMIPIAGYHYRDKPVGVTCYTA